MHVVYDVETGIVDKLMPDVDGSLALNVQEGQSSMPWVPTTTGIADYSWVEVDGDGNKTLHAAPPKPEHHEWDWTTKSWLPNLDAAKAAKKADIEAERSRRTNEPLTYDGKVLDADQTARDNLKAKLEEVRERIRLNMPMPPELLVWRDHGNQTHSWPTIEAYHDWLAGYAVTMSERGTRCYACAWYHKDALEQLSVLEDIVNYDLTQGWPT